MMACGTSGRHVNEATSPRFIEATPISHAGITFPLPSPTLMGSQPRNVQTHTPSSKSNFSSLSLELSN